MSFIEYARNHSFERDPYKLRFISTEDEVYPSLFEDDVGFSVVMPTPKIYEESISFLGYEFPNDALSKQHIARLFRASVYHLSAHAVASNYEQYSEWGNEKSPLLFKFVPSVIEDMVVNAFVAAWYPDRFADLSFACAQSLRRLRKLDNVRIRATRIMASLMIYANTGLRRFVSKEERGVVEGLFDSMDKCRDLIVKSIDDKEMDIASEKLLVADQLYEAIISHGPLIEAPSLPFTEDLGPNSLFPQVKVDPEVPVDDLLNECLRGIRGPQAEGAPIVRARAAREEALMVFDSHFIEKEKERKMLSKYEEFALLSRFKSMEFPDQDYTEYLRAKARCKKDTSKLTERLVLAMNAYMEDIRKLYGVLDLADAIQVVAGKSDRTDIFLLDEKIQKSYAWAILVDASTSMRHIRDYVLEMTIVLTESASKVLLDPSSWGVYAFNDSFYIVKDYSEQYNTRVRSRIGGLRFEGLTYMPDAIEITGRILSRRDEDLKIMAIISDGWPYGYSNVYKESQDIIKKLEASNMIVFGIGARSRRMEFLFSSQCAAFTLKEFVNIFGQMYIDVSLNVD
ncbi:MAG: hypothetical protein ACETVY_03525 [Candidatus Bathyarchaeia archaeon]